MTPNLKNLKDTGKIGKKLATTKSLAINKEAITANKKNRHLSTASLVYQIYQAIYQIYQHKYGSKKDKHG